MVGLAVPVSSYAVRVIVALLFCLVMWRTYLSRQCSMLGVVALLALAGCGDDGDDGAEPPDDGTSSTTSTTSTTQPPASGEEAVRPYVEDLLGEWDEAMSEILADPVPVEADPAHPLRAQLAESFTVDSPYVEDLGLLLSTGYIDQDVGVRPGPDGVSQTTTLLGFTEASADEPDFVSFVFCSYHDGHAYTLSTGDDLPADVGIRRGAGEARRVDGEWLLHRLRLLARPESQPVGTPNPCPDMAEVTGDS